jgi:hypothetical protein
MNKDRDLITLKPLHSSIITGQDVTQRKVWDLFTDNIVVFIMILYSVTIFHYIALKRGFWEQSGDIIMWYL